MRFHRIGAVGCLACCCLLIALNPTRAEHSRDAAGAAIYREQCASCHGKAGEGVADAFEKPLVGDLSVNELAARIATTMPEDAPEDCVGEDAAAVAAYIHHAFYSPQAQLRNHPPRVRLARLTNNQLRQSLADLYGHFTGLTPTVEYHGLQAEYFDGTNRRRDKRRVERIDPTIDFDFGHDGPGAKINPKDFSVQWQGALKAERTGRYEFVIRSTCAFVWYFGDTSREFVNNHVQSGDKTEFRRSVVLTAGRTYPLRIVFYQRKRKTEQPPASISLSWIPPGGVEHIVPARNLTSTRVPPAFSLQASLPPDDRTYGYERGISVDRQWDDATTSAALEFADAAARQLWPRYRRQHNKQKKEQRELLRDFLSEIAATAFRGPVDEDVQQLYIDAPVNAEPDDAAAIKRSGLMVLKSPRFLYPSLDADQTASRQAATRLALTLFDSLPSDQWLIGQANDGRLATEQGIRAAARRMVTDPRSRAKVRLLLDAWLQLDHGGEIAKDEALFEGFDASLVGDLRASLDTFLDEVVWSDTSDYRQLVRADWSYTTDRIERFYGGAWQSADPEAGLLRPTIHRPEQHQGVLSHPFVMSRLAYRDSTSPIHRGVFLIRYVLGRTLQPPQEAFSPLSPDLHPDLTTRERVALQTSPQGCQNCHLKINGLGFALENFDAVGRYRSKERGRPIDASGRYTARNDALVEFNGPQELADYIADSDDAHRAFVDRIFEQLVKQPVAAYGLDLLDELVAQFRANKFNIRELIVEIAVIAAKPPTDTATEVASDNLQDTP